MAEYSLIPPDMQKQLESGQRKEHLHELAFQIYFISFESFNVNWRKRIIGLF